MRKLILAVAALLSVLAISAQEKKAIYCGDVPGSFKKAFEGLYQTAGTHKDLIVPESGKVQLAVWAQLCKYTGKALGEQDRRDLHKFIEDGGIVVMYCAVPTLLYRPAPKKTFDLSLGTDTLGASGYEYGKTRQVPSETAKAIFGENVDKYNIYPAMKENHAALGKVDDMVHLFGSPQFIELGVNRIGKGTLIYTSAAASPAEYAEALRKLLEVVSDPQQLDRYFPVPAPKFPAVYCGNSTGGYQKVFAGRFRKKSAGQLFIIPESGQVKLAVWSQQGKYHGKAFTDEDREKLHQFISDGGIVVLAGAVPTLLFRPDPKKTYDLSLGTVTLGASAYVYARNKQPLPETAKTVFGDKAEAYNSIYANAKVNHPGLGKLSRMVCLFGNPKFVELGVNRVGKGVLIYTSSDPNTPEYAEALQKLLDIALDPEQLEIYFPAAGENHALIINGRTHHLALAPGSQSGAAQFFFKTVGRISGKTDFTSLNLPGEVRVHFGQTPYVKSLDLDWKPLHPYGYYLLCRDGKNIVIAGKTEAGTMFAANDFLKRFAGYRRFSNSEYFEVIPKRAAIEIPENFEICEQPAINSYYLAVTPNSAFGRNNRLNCMATHALSSLVPPKMYAESHPEYFPMVNGKRKKIKPSGKGSGPWNPCISHPDIPKLVEEYADRYFKQYPERLGLPLGVNDGGGDCQCEKCAAEFRETGNQYARFYNLAAKILAKKYPDKVVSFIAYSRTCHNVPKGVRMEPNVLVEITGMGRSAFAEMEKWKAAGIRHFGLYDYVYTLSGSFYLPRYYPRVMGRLWRDAYRNYHLESIWAEYFPRTAVFSAPRQYVLDEIAWNPDVDIEALLKDYFTCMYAEAAGPVQRLFDHFEKIYDRAPYKDIPIKYRGNPVQFEFFRESDFAVLDRAMADAVAAAKTPMTKRRVTAVQKLYEGIVRPNAESAFCAQELSRIGKIQSETDARKVLGLIARGYAAIRQFRSSSVTPQEEADIFVNLKKTDWARLKKSSSMNPQVYLEKQIDPVLDRVTAWLKSQNRDVVKFYEEAAAKAEPEVRPVLLSQTYLLTHKAVNLIRNPSFEDQRGETGKMLASDHLPFKGVSHWGTYCFPNSKAVFFLNKEVAHSGKNSGAIGEMQIHASLLTFARIDPGCRYRLSLYVRRNRGEEGFGYGGAGVRMQDRKGGWLDQGSGISVKFPPECENNWVQVSTTFTAPKVPATALILLSAPRQSEGAWTAFDDVSLVKIYDPAEDPGRRNE